MTSIWWRGSSEAVGSSARITGASTASTRASATRLRSPPDNSVTRRSREFHDIGRLHRPQHRLGISRRQSRRVGGAVRIAAERHDIPRRQRPVHDVALRQIGETPRAFAQRQRRQRIAADIDRAFAKEPGPPAPATAWSCRRRSAPPARPDVPTAATARHPSAPARPAELDAHVLRGEEGRRGHATPPPSARRSRMIR